MAQRWRDVRVFISSTFRDMHAERDHLVKVVFPALRESLLKDRIHLVDIDLRWGVTKEQADNDRVLDLCLQQIDACRPFFVGILGERYGWVPRHFPADAASHYGWIQAHTGKSLTELEILYGVLNSPEMRGRALFYFRDAAFIADVPESRKDIYREAPTEEERASCSPEDAEALAADRHRKLHDLKQRILAARGQWSVFENYPCRWDSEAYDPIGKLNGRVTGLEEFGERVRVELETAIRNAPELQQHFAAVATGERDNLAEEAALHDAFIESHLQIYIPREAVHRKLLEYLESGETRPLLVTGSSGSGKSAILAWLAQILSEPGPDRWRVVPHFVGASPRSTGIRDTLTRFCRELNRMRGVEGEIPSGIKELFQAFRDGLANVPEDQKAVFIIDAVNQFDDTDNAHDLIWLPRELPPNVKLVLSIMDDPEREQRSLRCARALNLPEVPLGPLTPGERFRIVTEVPSLSAKTLDPQQVQLLLSNPATDNPLFLLVALEELRGFGSFEDLDTRIAAFPRPHEEHPQWPQWLAENRVVAGQDPRKLEHLDRIEAALRTVVPVDNPLDAIFLQVLERLETDFDAGTVQTLLCLLASARRGLSERELQDLLESDLPSPIPQSPIRNPQSELFPVLRQLRPYLQHRGDLLDFFHRNLYKAVRQRYLDAEAKQQAAYRRLAEYFDAQDFWAESLEAQRERARRLPPTPRPANVRKVDELPWHWLRAHAWDELESLVTNLAFLEAKSEAGMTFDLVADFAGAAVALPRDRPNGRILGLLEEALRRDVYFIVRHPTTLFQCLWNSCWWYDCHEAAKHYVVPEGGWPPGEPPWEQSGPKLHQLLEAWHAAREEASPEFRWVRSLRPPATHLGTAQHAVFRGHEDSVDCVAYSPDGRRIVSGSHDHTVRVWDANTGEELQCLSGHKSFVSSVAYSSDGRRIASAAYDKTVRVCHADTGVELQYLPGDVWRVSSVAYSPDNLRIVSAGNTVQVWDADTGAQLLRLQGHVRAVESIAYSPDGRRIVSGSWDHTARVWDAETGAELRVLRGHKDCVSSVAYSPDGRRIVSGSHDRTVRVWDAETGAELRCLKGHEGFVVSVAYSPDGRRIVSGSHDRTVRVWDAETGAEPRRMSGHKDTVCSVAYSADGRRIVSGAAGYKDNTVRVWNAETGAELACLRGHEGNVWSVAYSPDGRWIVSGAEDRTVRVWDAETGAELRRLRGHESGVWSVAYSPDGRRIVSGAGDHTVRVWDVETGAELRRLRGHESEVWSVAYSPDGRWIASGSGFFNHKDYTVRVWDAEAGAELRCLRGHEGNVRTMTYSPDGRWILISSRNIDGKDHAVPVRDAETGECLEVTDGVDDVAAVAAWAARYPFRAIRSELETVIADAAADQPVAWFPVDLLHVATHPGGRMWAGTVANHLHIIRLEGGGNGIAAVNRQDSTGL